MIDEIIKQFAEGAIEQIQKNIREKGAYASGDTSKSLFWKWDGKELIIYSTFKYITVLETGRKPGKFAPVKEIQEWVKVKLNISDPKKVNSIGYAINLKLKENGSILYQRGGNSGILSSVANDQYVADNLTPKLLGALVTFATNEFLNVNSNNRA